MCLEFSKIQNSNLNFIYTNYSKLIPLIGKDVVGQKEPYEYLIKSIEEFMRLQADQYLWVHRRCKNRPEGEADLYQVALKKRSERNKSKNT